MIWWAVLAAGVACYLLKLAGLSVPERILEQGDEECGCEAHEQECTTKKPSGGSPRRTVLE